MLTYYNVVDNDAEMLWEEEEKEAKHDSASATVAP